MYYCSRTTPGTSKVKISQTPSEIKELNCIDTEWSINSRSEDNKLKKTSYS